MEQKKIIVVIVLIIFMMFVYLKKIKMKNIVLFVNINLNVIFQQINALCVFNYFFFYYLGKK
jgi:hypothetical protein